MSTYIVTFEHNRAISSVKADPHFGDLIDIDHTNKKDEIKKMTVFANSEEKSIERANEIAHQILAFEIA